MMTSPDFAAAQQRVLARQLDQKADAEKRIEAQRTSPASTALTGLPLPLSYLGRHGIGIWNTIKGREGTRPPFRVGQVDAELLDEELLGLLKGQVGEGLKFLGVCHVNHIVLHILVANIYIAPFERRLVG
jgi:peroxin-2